MPNDGSLVSDRRVGLTRPVETNEGPPWTTSAVGRLIWSAVGIYAIVLAFNPATGGLWGNVLAVALLGCSGTLLLALAWTERLIVRDGLLVARHIWGEKSVRLVDVVGASDLGLFTGIVVTTQQGERLRSWVTFRPTTNLWTPRSERVAKEISDYAAAAGGGDSPTGH